MAASLALLMLGSVPHAAVAQSAGVTRERLEEQKQTLRQKQEAERTLASDVRQIEAERERLNGNLVETAARIQKGEGQLTAIEGRMSELEAQERLLKGSLARQHGTIVQLLGAMQRMGRDPPPVMITRREDALVMVRSAMMLASVFPQLKTQALALAAKLEDLGRVLGEIKGEGEKLKSENQQLTQSRLQLSQLLEAKRRSLAERQEALDRVRREAVEIARNVSDLNELIARLDKVVGRQIEAPAERLADAPAAPLKPADAPAVARAAVAPAAVTAAATPAIPPADPLPAATAGEAQGVPTVVLAPKGTQVASLNPGRIKPAMPFASAKGRLPLPVQGKRIIGFGDKAQTSRSNGIVLETRPGAQVVSPTDGWIVFAGVFRSYGQILIINGGDGYHMLLAGLSQIDVQLGQFVLAGEPVGLMAGQARGAKTAPPTNSPVLYVELRKDGRSIDPDPWWIAEGTQKVQG